MPARTPSDKEYERAMTFLRTLARKTNKVSGEDRSLARIYQILKHSDIPLHPKAVSQQMGGACNQNDASSRLNVLLKWGLVQKTGTTISETTKKRITLWDVVAEVPRFFIKTVVPSYYLAVVPTEDSIVHGELISPHIPNQRERLVEMYPGCNIIRVIRRDLKIKPPATGRRRRKSSPSQPPQ